MTGVSIAASRALNSFAQTGTEIKTQTVQIWADNEFRKLPHAWEECVGSDRAIVATRAQWLSDLELVKKTAGVKSVRFHGLFNDEMGVWSAGSQPNFLYVDTVFDAMLERGIKPFVELSFMPAHLASGNKTIFWYRGNTTPPSKMSQWGELVGALGKHCVDRYGINEVASWNFEVWNEPNIGFWSGTKAEYLELYRQSAMALKGIDKRLRVGGPSTAQAAWVGDLLGFCADQQVPIDFASSHIYPDDPQKIVFGEGVHYPFEDVIPKALEKMQREIAEYWLMKKAYSPVRLGDRLASSIEPNQPLRLPIANWHNHTNLNELKVRWSVGEDKGELPCPNIRPREKGELVIPARSWKDGEKVWIVFVHGECIVDEYLVPIGSELLNAERTVSTDGGTCSVSDEAALVAVTGEDFQMTIDKTSGEIRAVVKGVSLIESAPSFHLVGAALDPWTLDSVDAKQNGKAVTVKVAGHHGAIRVSFALNIRGDGDLRLDYTVSNFSLRPPEKKLIPWNRTNAGGFSEVGISLLLTSRIDRLEWKRAGLYSVYPEDHIGRNRGVALRTKPGMVSRVAEKPSHGWSNDEVDFNLFGPDDLGGRGSNDFRSMKENIEFASAAVGEAGPRLRVVSDRSQAVRLEVQNERNDGKVKFIVNDLWNYTNLGLGNYMKPPVVLTADFSGSIHMRLE
jgi:hypothetical protein